MKNLMCSFMFASVYGDLEIYVFFVSARQKVIWLGVSGLTLNSMSWACKKTFCGFSMGSNQYLAGRVY